MNPAKHLSVVPVPAKSSTSGMRPIVKPLLSVVTAKGIAPMSMDLESPESLTDTPPELMFRGLLNVLIPTLLFDTVLVATIVHYFG